MIQTLHIFTKKNPFDEKAEKAIRILYKSSFDIGTAGLQTQKQTLCLKMAHTQDIC